jgi:hypothetical protein
MDTHAHEDQFELDEISVVGEELIRTTRNTHQHVLNAPQDFATPPLTVLVAIELDSYISRFLHFEIISVSHQPLTERQTYL